MSNKLTFILLGIYGFLTLLSYAGLFEKFSVFVGYCILWYTFFATKALSVWSLVLFGVGFLFCMIMWIGINQERKEIRELNRSIDSVNSNVHSAIGGLFGAFRPEGEGFLNDVVNGAISGAEGYTKRQYNRNLGVFLEAGKGDESGIAAIGKILNTIYAILISIWVLLAVF